MAKSWLREVRCLRCAIGLLLVGLLSSVATPRAQDYSPGLLMVVLPDSVLPLAVRDTAGPPLTSCPCFDTLNTTHGFLNLYKAYPHQDFRLEGTYIVVFPDTADVDSLAAAYLASNCVVSASGVPTVQYDALPDDPLFLNTGGNPGERQWALDADHSRVSQAWDITTGDSNLVVAVVDQGVFWEHPDLIHSMWVNAAEDINHNGTFECWSSTEQRNGTYGDLDSIDNDENGYPDDVVGIKTARGVFDPDVRLFEHDHTPSIAPDLDTAFWHGTFVASIIGGRADNGTGAAGAAGGWNQRKGVRIMAAVPGTDTPVDIVNAVKYAIDAGADIINMSFAWFAKDTKYWQALLPSVKMLDSVLAVAFFDSNMICVASAGNETDNRAEYPAAFGQEAYYTGYPEDFLSPNRVIGVGSLDSLNARCPNSTWGSTWYDFGAHGLNWGACVQGFPDSIVYGYSWSGCRSAGCATSWSTPLASAVVGLVWSAFPELDNQHLIARLRGASPSPPDGEFSSGMIDAFEPMVWWPTPDWDTTLRLYADVVVPAGDTLSIQPGTDVLLPGGDFANQGLSPSKVEIIVNGTLVARGDSLHPITFRADPPGGYDKWEGIHVKEGGKIILDHVNIENAVCGIKFDSAGVCSVRASTVSHCQSLGLDIASQDVSIRGSRIRDIYDGYGIRVDNGATVKLYGDTVSHAYGGIEFYATGSCSLQACLIDSCDVHGVYTQSDNLAIVWTTISDCPYGIYGVNSDVNLYRTFVHRCGNGVYLDETSGGQITWSRIGDSLDTGTGLALLCSPYVYQTKVEGPATSQAVAVNGSNPTFYECKIDGHGSGRTGIWSLFSGGPKVRCSQIVGFTYRGVYGNKSDLDLGIDATGEHGNNTFDALAAVTIQTLAKPIKAEKNYYWCAPDTVDCDSQFCSPGAVFSGQVDYTPWLHCVPDSCGYAEWDTTSPPCCGNNRLVTPVSPPSVVAAQNYPNPFNPSTVIRYTLDRAGQVEVTVYNVLGQQVRVLVNEMLPSGVHEVTWDGKDGRGEPVSSGVYFYRIRSESQLQTKKMAVLR